MTDYAAIMQVLRDLALKGGAETMRFYETDVEVETKDDESPVTAADKAADAVITAGLRAAFPDIPVVTEEESETHDAGAAGARFFLVDPLDGTKEFIKKRGEFTVNIALIEDGKPTHGVVYAPAKGRLFRSLPGGGAVEESEGAEKPLSVSIPDNRALRVVASKSHRDQATDDYINKYNVVDMKSAGSSLKFCLLAAGEADFYPRLGRTMEWDTAAGHAVLAAAGGEVDRLEGGALLYGKPGFENPFFVAYAPGVHLL